MSVDLAIVPLDFGSLEPYQALVPIMGKNYILREASGAAAVKYRNSQIRGTKLADGKPVAIGDNVAISEPELVANCLYRADKEDKLRLDKDGNPDVQFQVPIHIVLGWPQRVQKALFERVKEVSDLEEKETEEVLTKRLKETQEKLDALQNGSAEKDSSKNLQSATTAGSA